MHLSLVLTIVYGHGGQKVSTLIICGSIGISDIRIAGVCEAGERVCL
ncbi:hypothetical protein B4168_3043 [Anoxybacillus flavithermus]|nr:hypothetical protein B4168_3043 [Anoxybacillus flavithermus]OAO86331.1 hypothetical protein GT23_2224 [Parageobacillus thermoglucosidasius]